MSHDIEVAIHANDEQTVWDIHIESDGVVSPQDVIDGIADYFMMLGWHYAAKISSGDEPN